MPTRPLFRTVETAAAITDSVLGSFSGGKDSVATLDLCVKHFRHVEGFQFGSNRIPSQPKFFIPCMDLVEGLHIGRHSIRRFHQGP